jgi:hypothetical protein
MSDEIVQSDFEKQMEAMRAKNQQLLDEVKGLKATLREQNGIKPEDFAKLEKERDELIAKNTEAAKILKQLTKERDDATSKAQAESAANHKLLVDNGLTDALTKAGIRKEFLPAARALLKEQGIIGVEADGDIRRAVAKLADGKLLPLEEYVSKHFAASDEGKAFIPADGNSGGGTGGPNRSGVQPLDIKAQYNEAVKAGNADLAMALKERMAGAPRV